MVSGFSGGFSFFVLTLWIVRDIEVILGNWSTTPISVVDIVLLIMFLVDHFVIKAFSFIFAWKFEISGA